MTGRSVVVGMLIASAMAAASGVAQPARSLERAQSIKWNAAAMAADTIDDAPSVQLWLEGPHTYAYGTPVRVRFRVSEDAYVVVARVDANGHLTLLYPSSRTMSAGVEGGREIQVWGRRQTGAFYATDRVGGGFVFALASYDPFVLTRLGIRDFDRYVTGTYVGRPTQVYIGNPHDVISRFASMVSFSDASPFDYAVEFYNVDAPYYVSSAGYSAYCSDYNRGYSSGYYRPTLAERWDDEFYYGSGIGQSFGCGADPRCGVYSLINSGFLNWYGTGGSFYPNCLPRDARNNSNNPPTTPPHTDSLKVPRWLTDSVGGRTPDTVGVIPVKGSTDEPNDVPRQEPNSLRRSTTGTEGPRRPVVIADDPSDNSYAIPGRALRNSHTTIGQTRDPSAGAPLDRPDRRSAGAGNGSEIDWVRPPREVVRAPQSTDEGLLPRSPRQPGNGIDRSPRGNGADGGGRPAYVNPSTPDRGGRVRAEPPRFDPPTRTQGPRFDAPRPTERTTGSSGPRYYEPPRNPSPRYDSPRPSGGSPEVRGADRSPPVRAEPAHSPPPRPAPAASTTTGSGSGEKKPEKPEKP